MNWILVLSLLGAVASVYAFYLERKVSKNSKYKAVCDINDKMSCTKAFSSGYGKLFGVSNGVMGIIFYLLIIAMVLFQFSSYIFYLAILSVLASLYLWYLLTFKVKAVCVVCYTIYGINIALLILSYLAR